MEFVWKFLEICFGKNLPFQWKYPIPHHLIAYQQNSSLCSTDPVEHSCRRGAHLVEHCSRTQGVYTYTIFYKIYIQYQTAMRLRVLEYSSLATAIPTGSPPTHTSPGPSGPWGRAHSLLAIVLFICHRDRMIPYVNELFEGRHLCEMTTIGHTQATIGLPKGSWDGPVEPRDSP